jgi:hypothetical protein
MPHVVNRSGSGRLRPRRWLRLPLVLCVAVAMLLVPVAAQAYSDPPVKLGTQSQYLPDSTGWAATNSPRAIPGVDPSSVAESWYLEEWEASAEFDLATSAELHSELDSLLLETGAWDWGVLPQLAAGAAAGWVGWQIGSAVWGIFFEDASPSGSGTPRLANQWIPERPGSVLLSDGSGNATAPAWGLGGFSSSGPPGRITNTGACEIELYGDGNRVYGPGWISATFCGISQYRNYVLFRELDAIKCGTVAACNGINPVTYNGAGQPTLPTAEQLQSRVASELDTSDYPVVNRWVNHEAEPENYPNPLVTRTEEDHRCDRAAGASYQNPGGNADPDPFTKYYETPFAITNRPPGYGSTEIYLHYGSTRWIPAVHPEEAPWYRDAWDGWGYRHIQAKHGWSELDREETQLALAEDTAPVDQGNGKWLYKAPVPTEGEGGVTCTRDVVVDFEPGEGDPRPRGIVTSFNAVG